MKKLWRRRAGERVDLFRRWLGTVVRVGRWEGEGEGEVEPRGGTPPPKEANLRRGGGVVIGNKRSGVRVRWEKVDGGRQ